MSFGGTCRQYGRRMSDSSCSEHRMESLDKHRVTCLFPGSVSSMQTVKYSGTSWIAIRVQELIFTLTHRESQDKHAKLDLSQICRSPFYNMMAVVSSALGSLDESGIAASLAKFNEKAASRFLRKALKKDETFTFEEAVQITISAFCRLFPGNIKANEIQFSVMTNDQRIALPIEATEALLENKNKNFCSVSSLPIISFLPQQGILTCFPTIADTISGQDIKNCHQEGHYRLCEEEATRNPNQISSNLDYA